VRQGWHRTIMRSSMTAASSNKNAKRNHQTQQSPERPSLA
jgi:hypothetical protein